MQRIPDTARGPMTLILFSLFIIFSVPKLVRRVPDLPDLFLRPCVVYFYALFVRARLHAHVIVQLWDLDGRKNIDYEGKRLNGSLKTGSE